MLPKISATLTMLSHGATTPPLCPSEFRTPDRQLATNCRGQEYPRTRFRVCIGEPGGSISPARIVGDLYPGRSRSLCPGCRCDAPDPPGCGLALIVQGGQSAPPVGIQVGDRRQLVAARRLYSIADVCICGTTWQHSFSPARSSHIVTAPETVLFSVFCVRHKTLLEYSQKGSQRAGNRPQRGRANIMAAKPCRTAKTKAARRIG